MGASCRLLPHGGYTLIPTVLSTMAWIASVFQDGCDYAIIEGPVVQTITDDNDAVPWVEVGYAAYRTPEYNLATGSWEITYSGRCSNYNFERVEMDPTWKAAKAFAFLALVLGGGGTLFLWFSTCCIFSKATWRWAGHEVMLACLFQALAFLWFENSMCHYRNTCSLSWGSKADVVACVFWAMAALAIFCKYPEPSKLPSSEMQRIRETTDPEITISPSFSRTRQRLGSPTATIATGTTASPTSTHDENSEIAAALPLEGDATATISPNRYQQYTGGKILRDVEVL